MESWLVSGNIVVCPQCKSEWDKADNQTHRYKRCPNCGVKLKQSGKQKPLDMMLTVSKAYCSPDKFKINGVKATTYDFGQGVDEEPLADGKFGCGHHAFHHFERPKNGVLEKYHISMEDYRTICSTLDAQLSRGRCKYCG